MNELSFVPGRVTAIVASYNHAEFLDERMRSLIDQTYNDLEILVIDDKSTDNSPDVLSTYQNNAQVRIFLESQNRGWVSTSNLGAERAAGEFIIFTNCDDACNKNMISELANILINETDAVFAWAASSMINEQSNVIGSDRDYREKRFIEQFGSGGFIDALSMRKLLFHSCVIPNLSAVLIRKEQFLKVGGFDNKYSVVSDWDLFFKLCDFGGGVYIADHLNFFRQHGTTIRQRAKTIRLLNEYTGLLCSNLPKLDQASKLEARFKIVNILLNQIMTERTVTGRISLLRHLAILLFPRQTLTLCILAISSIRLVFVKILNRGWSNINSKKIPSIVKNPVE